MKTLTRKSFSLKENLIIFHHPVEVLYLLIGPVFSALAITLFYTPAKISGGGSTGVGVIIYYLFGLDQGVTMFLVNVPLVIAGIIVFGLKYGLKVFLGSSLLSFYVSLINMIFHHNALLDVSEPTFILMSSIFGGLLMGLGIGITMKSGCNTGGTDILAQIISHYTPFSVGSVLLCSNAVVVACAGFILGLEPMLFSLVAMFVSSHAVNYVLVGVGTKLSKSVYIVSDKLSNEISERVTKELGHSGTKIKAEGIYTKKDVEMLLVIVPNNQLRKLIQIINEEDPKAFVFVQEAYQVLGNGFKPIKKVAEDQSQS